LQQEVHNVYNLFDYILIHANTWKIFWGHPLVPLGNLCLGNEHGSPRVKILMENS